MNNDQAERLRQKIQAMSQRKKAKTLAVISGKGGVGKSNFSLNFALSLQQQGEKVLLFDLDIGMGNIEILLGRSSNHSIVHFFQNKLSFNDIINHGPLGLDYIAGGTGLANLFALDENLFERFTKELTYIIERYDYIVFDMGAGITADSLKFILSVEEILLLTTPEPTALTDAYASIKYILLHSEHAKLFVVVNRCLSEKMGLLTFERLAKTIEKFLNESISYTGCLPEDRNVMKAVVKQTPILMEYSHSSFSIKIQQIAARFNQSNGDNASIRSTNFVDKLRGFFKRG